MTATRHDHHSREFLEDNIRTGIKVDDRNAREFGWSTARFAHVFRVHQMDQSLHNGMVGGVHMRIQGK